MPARPGLWIVATPIGNLLDLSDRARQALECADRVLCEDTRRTLKLLNAFGIKSKTERFDEHSGQSEIDDLIEQLKQGQSLALVSDAGTPAISDPGARLVRAAWQAGIEVSPVPGPSAPVALLSAAGVLDTVYCFRGFFPRKSADKKKEVLLCQNSKTSRTFIWFESPQRIGESLETIAQEVPDVRLFVSKELTKLHEKIWIGAAQEVIPRVAQHLKTEGALGEWCVGIEFTQTLESGLAESSDWVKALQCLLDLPLGASDAARRVSQYFGISKNLAYETALKLSNKKY